MTDNRKQFLHDVFVTAMEGGIGYWSIATKYHWMNKETEECDLDGFYANIVDAMSAGDTDFADTEPDFPPSTINRKVIQRGLKLIREGKAQIAPSIKEWIVKDDRENEMSRMDANAADCVVQIGLFDQIVYG